jgi:hypothetical protein
MLYNITGVQTKCTLVKQFLCTCFGHSCGHLQRGDTKYKKLKDDTIIEVTETIQDIKRLIKSLFKIRKIKCSYECSITDWMVYTNDSCSNAP